MNGEVHLNRVLYKRQPSGAKASYRQITVVESNNFQVRIFQGDVVQLDPKFIADNPDAEVYFHTSLKEAIEDAESEVQQSISTQEWKMYKPAFPPG